MTIKRLVLIVSTFVLSLPLFGQSVDQRSERFTMTHRGHVREYYLYRPSGLKEGAPLVMAIHGYGGGVKDMPGDLLDAADRFGYAICLPQGLADPTGHTGWNVGYCFQQGYKLDDVDFVCDLTKKLQKEYGFDKEATFLTGMSNGGEMCYLIAMRRPKTFKAIASIAGLTMSWMLDAFEKTGPVPFMEVHGTQDHVSEWYGDPDNQGGWGAYTAVPLAVSRVVIANGCREEHVEELPQRQGRNKVTLYKYTNGDLTKDGKPMEVWLYEISGGDHAWGEEDMDTYAETWKFFQKWM